VGAEEGGADLHPFRLAERARHPQAFALVLQRQPIARLDLDCGDAFGPQRAQPRQRLRASDASSAARVACTVDAMPPPARAISS
jgi:hypothetical protein